MAHRRTIYNHADSYHPGLSRGHRLFESEFLTATEESQEAYRQFIARVVETICSSLPAQSYRGKTATELATLIDSEIFPKAGSSREIAGKLATIVSNSVVVTHPQTVAHLHCPPLVSALAAEVVISTLNQSMDSFDQAPIATLLEQKLIRWLCVEAGMPDTSGGTSRPVEHSPTTWACCWPGMRSFSRSGIGPRRKRGSRPKLAACEFCAQRSRTSPWKNRLRSLAWEPMLWCGLPSMIVSA